MMVTDSRLMLLLLIAGIFMAFMIIVIMLTLSRMKKRRQNIGERIKQLEEEMGLEYK